MAVLMLGVNGERQSLTAEQLRQRAMPPSGMAAAPGQLVATSTLIGTPRVSTS